ncbi:Major_facilitator superfamily protein [Hexamita inflata]|uniref:Major facilitator superfamily protein n=1 Tax=Hexamita inflata TaxID=28002 RepID=A0AA86P2N2_9EUKA|nr:Major facilitator superfamily protein [Hexamita inflata]
MRFKVHETTPIKLSCITALGPLIGMMSSCQANTNLNVIKNLLQLSTAQASWLLNIETLLAVIMTSFVGKVSERIGCTLTLSIGTLICAISNLLVIVPEIYSNYLMLLLFRGISAIGIGFLAPATMPTNYMLVQPGKLAITITISSVMIPVAGILVALSAGMVASSIGYQYMFLFVGCISLFTFICQIIWLPYDIQKNKRAKIDFIGVSLMSIGLCSLVIGLLSFSEKEFIPLWAKILLSLGGLIILIIFYFYDQKKSSNKVFQPQLLNKTILTSATLILIVQAANFGERYLTPFNVVYNIKYKNEMTGVIMAIVCCSAFPFSPITNILLKKVIVKRILIIIGLLYGLLMLLNGFMFLYFPSFALYTVVSFINMGLFLSAVIITQTYNFAQCPQKYNQQMGVLNHLMAQIGNVSGIILAVVIQVSVDENLNTPDIQYDPLSVAAVYWTFAGLFVIFVLLASRLGMLPFERGKNGYIEREMSQTESFEESFINSDEMVFTEQFQGEGQIVEGYYI